MDLFLKEACNRNWLCTIALLAFAFLVALQALSIKNFVYSSLLFINFPAYLVVIGVLFFLGKSLIKNYNERTEKRNSIYALATVSLVALTIQATYFFNKVLPFQEHVNDSYKIVDREFEKGSKYVKRGYVLTLQINEEKENIWVSKKSYFDSYQSGNYQLSYNKSFFYDYIVKR